MFQTVFVDPFDYWSDYHFFFNYSLLLLGFPVSLPSVRTSSPGGRPCVPLIDCDSFFGQSRDVLQNPDLILREVVTVLWGSRGPGTEVQGTDSTRRKGGDG